MLGADEDLSEVFVLPFRQDALGAAHHDAGEADDGAQRGPQLVGHARKELGLVT